MTSRTTKDRERSNTPGEDNTTPRDSSVIALIRRDDHELMGELFVAVEGDLEICIAVEGFIDRCAKSQYMVAVLPVGVLPERHRALLRGTLGAMSLRPSLVMYSPNGDAVSPLTAILDAGDLTVVVRPFTAERLREAVTRAANEFEERAKRRRC